MTICIDADTCPVTRIAERVAKEHAIPVVLLCDTNHVLSSDYSEIRVIGVGADAVNITLINLYQRDDIRDGHREAGHLSGATHKGQRRS